PRTSLGDMSIRPGRGCCLAMCVERRLVETCSPQNLQRAFPAEMWTRCIHSSMRALSPARQARVEISLPGGPSRCAEASRLDDSSHVTIQAHDTPREVVAADRQVQLAIGDGEAEGDAPPEMRDERTNQGSIDRLQFK